MLSFKETLVQKLDLVMTLTVAQMKARYRKTVAGFLWVILNPILTFTVQALIFKRVLNANVDHYYQYLLAGIIPWIFITSTITMTVSSFVSNRSVLMAFKLDPWVIILSQVLDNFINFVAGFLILLLLTYNQIPFTAFTVPFFILIVLQTTIFTFFFSFLLAMLHIFFRDTQFIVSFVLSLAYFATPVFYPKDLIPQQYHFLIDYNPLYVLIRPFQNLLWHYDYNLFMESMGPALLCTVLFMVLSLIYWRKKKYDIYFRL